jgi:hypothetical protein
LALKTSTDIFNDILSNSISRSINNIGKKRVAELAVYKSIKKGTDNLKRTSYESFDQAIFEEVVNFVPVVNIAKNLMYNLDNFEDYSSAKSEIILQIDLINSSITKIDKKIGASSQIRNINFIKNSIDSYLNETCNKPIAEEKEADKYWNGGEPSDPIPTKKSADFWTGEGSSVDEKYRENNVHPDASNQFIGELESTTKTIIVKYRDHGAIDGDKVRILINNKVFQDEITLSARFSALKIPLDFGMNKLDFQALNEGSQSPNTAEFMVYDNNNKLISSEEWNILKGFTATLLITKF